MTAKALLAVFGIMACVNGVQAASPSFECDIWMKSWCISGFEVGVERRGRMLLSGDRYAEWTISRASPPKARLQVIEKAGCRKLLAFEPTVIAIRRETLGDKPVRRIYLRLSKQNECVLEIVLPDKPNSSEFSLLVQLRACTTTDCGGPNFGNLVYEEWKRMD